jgi:hypothetical protein
VPMSSMPVASIPVPFIPMPATVGVPWHRADQEQHGDHDEYPYPRPPCCHGLTSVLTRMFPCGTPPDATLHCIHNLPRVTTGTRMTVPWLDSRAPTTTGLTAEASDSMAAAAASPTPIMSHDWRQKRPHPSSTAESSESPSLPGFCTLMCPNPYRRIGDLSCVHVFRATLYCRCKRNLALRSKQLYKRVTPSSY